MYATAYKKLHFGSIIYIPAPLFAKKAVQQKYKKKQKNNEQTIEQCTKHRAFEVLNTI